MKATKIIFYLSYVLLQSASCGKPPAKSAGPVRPNILFIAVDDLRPELGCYGNSYIHSPNIDKLASRGRLFLNHYVNVPTCGASRYSMLTGRYPQNQASLQNNIFEKTTAGKEKGAEPESMIELFRRNGYYTVGIGKISHAVDGRVYGYNDAVSNKWELPNSWDQFLFNAGKWETGWNAFFGFSNGESRTSLGGNVKPYESANVEDNGLPDGLTAELATHQLDSLKKIKQPFLLAVGFFKPHLPFTAPKKYWDLYNEDGIELSPAKNIPAGMHAASLHNNAEFNQYKKGEEKPTLNNPVSDAYARKLRHAYYAAVSYVDAQIGKVLDHLKATGLDKNTIIVLWGDHGWHLGDQRVWGKHTLSEYSLRSPLIISYPGIQKPGECSKAIVESVDIYPTLLSLAGCTAMTKLDGRTLAPLLNDPVARSNQMAFGYFNKGITLRTERYRITKYYRKEQPTIELYDHQLDPFETKNIAKQNPVITDSLFLWLRQGDTGLYK